MEVELSKEKITLRDLSWGEELDAYEKAESFGGRIKNTVLHREVEINMTGKSKEWIDSLSRDDGKTLREAVLKKWNLKGDDTKK